MKPGLKLKSSLFLALLLMLTVTALSFFVLRGIRINQTRQNEEYLIQQGIIAGNYMKQMYLMESVIDPDNFLREKSWELVKRFEMITGMQTVLYDMSGKKLADTTPMAGETDISTLMEYALKDTNAYVIEGDTMVFLAPLHNSEGQIGVLQFNYSNAKDKAFYKKIKVLFLFGGILIFLFCFLCGHFYLNPLIQGILKLKRTAQKIKEGNFSSLTPLNRKDELGDLSRDIYFMGTRIKTQMEEMKQEKDNLKMAVEKLEILGLQQKQFIGNVTHEFKTPLTVIKAYSDLMNLYQDDPKLVLDAKENIDKEIIRLSDMLDKVLTLSALENYKIDFFMEPLDIEKIITDVCEHLEVRIKQQGLNLHRALEKQYITGDKERLNQIFLNLIDNAIKYNRENGHIWVSVKREYNEVCVQIKDTGIGIPSEAREKLFTPFFTVDKAHPQSTGLGLALVKELTEKQGGTIKLLEGTDITTFEVRFPSYNCLQV